jgi:2-haloacid dehalogenase
MDIKNIIFDFGGVLIDWNPRHLYRTLFEDGADMEYFLTHVCNNSWNLEQDRGRSFKDGIALLQQEFPQYESMIQAYHDKWETMLKGEIKENINLMLRLKKKYKIYGLTNFSAETYPILIERLPVFNKFDGIVVSGYEKMVKPEKDIYKLLISRYSVEPAQSIFIDDLLENIITARELGFFTIHYNVGINLEDVLARMKLI